MGVLAAIVVLAILLLLLLTLGTLAVIVVLVLCVRIKKYKGECAVDCTVQHCVVKHSNLRINFVPRGHDLLVTM